MADRRATNRAMFWRIIRRLLGANRGRLFVMMLALGAGAAVTAALLNLQVDAKRRLTGEFRSFGANVLVLPKGGGSTASADATLDESILNRIPVSSEENPVTASAHLFVLGDVSTSPAGEYQRVVIAGMHAVVADDMMAAKAGPPAPFAQRCIVGRQVADQMHFKLGDRMILRGMNSQESCQVIEIRATGSAEDSQVVPHLDVVQRLAGLPHRISLIQVTVAGNARRVDQYITELQQQLPEVDVRPIRQFTEGEAKIYNRISGLLTATVGIVLLLTGLCVMAAMTNVAMERRNDVGLMKAIGGSMRRVLRLFLAEAALLGLAGGIIGAAVGIFLSIGLGKAVFGVAAQPRLIVYPVAVALTVIVAILSAFPLRRLASIRPASVFRGEA